MAFLRTEKPRPFQYIPRYYDEQKENLKERIERVKNDLKTEENGEYKPNIKGKFKKRHEAFYGMPAKASKRSLSRWLMLIIYAALVIAIIYLVLNALSALA